MKETLNTTDILQKGDKIKFRNLYCYHMEKIKNSHLEQKVCQNKVNEVFSMHSKLVKKLDPKTLTKKLCDLVNTKNIGKEFSDKIISNVLDDITMDESDTDKERNVVNNRFITDYQTNFVQPENVKKRTATEIIGVNAEIKKKQVEKEEDAQLLLKLKDEVEMLTKRSHFYNSDKENEM